MKCIRIFPDTWASTMCLLASSTRNIVLGNASTTVPSTVMVSSFAILSSFLPREACRAAAFSTLSCQNPGSVRRDRHRVLEVRRETVINRHDGPAIFERQHVGFSDVHHRLDGNHES